MSNPIVSRLWIAAADRAIDRIEIRLSDEVVIEIRERLRDAAVEVEGLMSIAADGRRAERSEAVAALMGRFGVDAIDVDRIAATAIADAAAASAAAVGLGDGDARRVAEACLDAVLDAAATLDATLPIG